MMICINIRWEEKLYISAFSFSSKCFGLLTETLFTCKTFAFTQETLEMNTLWVNADFLQERKHHHVPLRQWSQTQFLEGHSSVQSSSNQLQFTPAWKFLVILKTLISWIRCVWLGLELNCAELWTARNWVWDHCFKGSIVNVCKYQYI